MEMIKKDFNLSTWMLFPAAIGINGAVGWIVNKLDLPLYMDTIGTIFIAVVAGPWAGALTGVLTNIILGIFSPEFIPYWPVPLFIGLVAGLCANAGLFKTWVKAVVTGLLVAVTAAALSTLISMQIHEGLSLSAAYFLVQEPLDKVATALIVWSMTRMLPQGILAVLPRPENLAVREVAK